MDFIGTYAPLSFTAADPSILFLGADNTLNYPISGATIGAQRAYFKLKNVGSGVREFRLNFGEGDEDTQGIEGIDNLTIYDLRFETDAWYSLDGVRLSGKPTKKGLYINNGRKVVIP